MAALRDILAYLLARYPYASELSNARVTKMVYLADWRHAIENGAQMSPVQWVFNNYGPFVWDIKDAAEANPTIFAVSAEANYFGSPKLLLSLRDKEYVPQLQASEKAAIDHVVESTKKLTWESFIRLVYSTYPIIRSARFSVLDLRGLAAEYNATVRNQPDALIV